MRRLLLIVMFLLMSQVSKSQGCLTADVVLILDWSSSESGNEEKLASAASEFVSVLDISDIQLRVAVITFCNKTTIVSKLNGDKEDLTTRVSALRLYATGGGTWITESIETSLAMLNNTRDVSKFIIIISDGAIPDASVATWYLQSAKSKMQLQVFAVQIADPNAVDIEDGFYNLSMLTGDSKKVEVSTITGLVESLKRLSLCN